MLFVGYTDLVLWLDVAGRIYRSSSDIISISISIIIVIIVIIITTTIITIITIIYIKPCLWLFMNVILLSTTRFDHIFTSTRPPGSSSLGPHHLAPGHCAGRSFTHRRNGLGHSTLDMFHWNMGDFTVVIGVRHPIFMVNIKFIMWTKPLKAHSFGKGWRFRSKNHGLEKGHKCAPVMLYKRFCRSSVQLSKVWLPIKEWLEAEWKVLISWSERSCLFQLN